MPTYPAKPLSVRDPEPQAAPDPARSELPRRRRALHPAIVVAVAAVAVSVASVVGTVVFGGTSTRPAAAADIGTSTPGSPVYDVTAAGVPADAPAAPGLSAAASQAAPASTRSPAGAAPAPTRSPAGATPAPKPSPTSKTADDPGAETAVLNLVNQERAKAGCNPLTADSRLATAARLHSQDMAARNYFDHTTPDGVTFDQRITNAGYRWSGAAENIAKGQTTPASVMQSWMNSPGHRANILNCGFKDLGVGLAYQGKTPIWTQDFGTPLG